MTVFRLPLIFVSVLKLGNLHTIYCSQQHCINPFIATKAQMQTTRSMRFPSLPLDPSPATLTHTMLLLIQHRKLDN
ncbi:hypothetical protein EDC04DRAFT_982283 [Pisolithus marmoratus]|nr:hypothetical protein EDC04DRAFT_982283 [Pisolithus marmoratus]